MANRDIFLFFVLLASTLLINSATIHGRLMNSTKQAPKGTIKTMKMPDGDVVYCLDMYKQPALEHPLLKNHILQTEPSKRTAFNRNHTKLSKIFQSWNCPDGSVPIRRQVNNDIQVRKRKPVAPESVNSGHQYAITQFSGNAIQGAYATIDIWKPSLAIPEADFSLTQIWVLAGSGTQLNSMEAGWHVYPKINGDTEPRFFIYWTADGYATTGCYDLSCPGFVQTNNEYAPGVALQPSVYQGQQNEFILQIEKDQQSGNYWLYVSGTAIGYWPSALYQALQQGASVVQWGGEIYDSSGSGGFHTLTQMGSGYLASQGEGQASYVRNLNYVDSSFNVVPLTQDVLATLTPAPSCYNEQFEQGQDGSAWFFYGGPGCN
ncbi:neprosin-like protein [Drosera capensis]